MKFFVQMHIILFSHTYLVASKVHGTAAVTLFSNRELDTLALGQADPWLLLSNDEDVRFTSGKGVVNGILDVDDVETTIVALTMGDDTNTSHVTTTGSHGNGTSVELDEVSDLSSSQIDLYSIVDLDSRVRVTDRSSIVRNQEWDSAFAELNTLDFAQLVFGLLGLDAVDSETALGVIDETEVLASLVDSDHVHEAGGVGGISADFSVDLDETLHEDGVGLTRVKGILQTVTNEDDERQAISQLVRTGRWARSIGTGQFVQEPVRWRTQALLMLLWSTAHDD